jgi:S-DNA-T family DNA segregation ATPase FtsK/SpoIIIE
LLAWLADSQQVAPARPLVIVDDVDVLAQGCPLEVDRLGDLAADGSLTVIASATSLSASMGHRGLVGHLRSLRCGVITDPAERGADDVFGTCLDDAVDLWCRIPGRAAIIDDTVVLPAQIFQVGA